MTETVFRIYKRIKGKTPFCHALTEHLEREGYRDRIGIVAGLADVGRSTIKGWLPGGDTISPRVETAGRVLAAIGAKIEIVQERQIDLNKELKLAADWAEKYDRPFSKPRGVRVKKKRNGRA